MDSSRVEIFILSPFFLLSTTKRLSVFIDGYISKIINIYTLLHIRLSIFKLNFSWYEIQFQQTAKILRNFRISELSAYQPIIESKLEVRIPNRYQFMWISMRSEM